MCIFNKRTYLLKLTYLLKSIAMVTRLRYRCKCAPHRHIHECRCMSRQSQSSGRFAAVSVRRYQLIEVLPVVLRHQTERAQQRPREVVEVRKSVVGVRTDSDALVTRRAFATHTRSTSAACNVQLLWPPLRSNGQAIMFYSRDLL